MMSDPLWLLLKVECAECAGGEQQLISAVRVFDSAEAAKQGITGEFPEGDWKPREAGGGYFKHGYAGGWEVVPVVSHVPDPKNLIT